MFNKSYQQQNQGIEMTKFDFYIKWLLFVSIAIALFGICIALFKNGFLSPIMNDLFNPAFWPNNVIDEGTIRFKNLTWCLFGSMMTMWGIMLFGIVKNALIKKEMWAWNSIFYSTCAWFVIDEGFSLYYHVWINAAANIPFLILIAIPLVMTRKFMTK
jgi:uncharacterized BrkB/YihY/UPF0761 family membrane protein